MTSDANAINMGQYNSSFNQRIHASNTLTGKDIDLLDNDYFEVNVYSVNETSNKFWRDPAIQAVKCSAYQEEKTKGYKKGGVCLGNRDKINLKANW